MCTCVNVNGKVISGLCCVRFCHQMEDWYNKLNVESSQVDHALDTFSKAQEKSVILREKLSREQIVLEEKGKVLLYL